MTREQIIQEMIAYHNNAVLDWQKEERNNKSLDVILQYISDEKEEIDDMLEVFKK